MLLLLLAVTGGNLMLGFGIAIAMGHGPRIDWDKIRPYASVTGVVALLRGKGLGSAPDAHGHGHDAPAVGAAHGEPDHHGAKPDGSHGPDAHGHGSHGH